LYDKLGPAFELVLQIMLTKSMFYQSVTAVYYKFQGIVHSSRQRCISCRSEQKAGHLACYYTSGSAFAER